MQLRYIKEISGKIILKTGLHIGGGDTELKIGGTDNTVVKHPHTQEPYIPGSSLKGKVRSLLEMQSDLMNESEGWPLSVDILKKKGITENQIKFCKNILKLFGASGAEEDQLQELKLGPTRVSFADCPLNQEWKKDASAKMLPFVEVKSENRINRISGTARDPRFIERVPAQTRFDFRITLKKMEDEQELEDLLLKGLKLLSMDYLGGSGSRGYGRIEFRFDDQDISDKFDKIDPFGE